MELTTFWVYFNARPLFWIVITLGAYLSASMLNRKAGGTALLHPVLVAMLMIILLLTLSGTDYDTYFEGAQFIHFLLGPATVALAVPLYDHRARIRQMLLPLLVVCLSGSLTAVVTTLLIGQLFGASDALLLSMAPKSVTSPIAIGISEQIGGFPSLSAGLSLTTGVMGCLLAPLVFRVLKVRSHTSSGFALGLAAHGFGTAYAMQRNTLAGAFAGLAMGMTGIFSSVLIPLISQLFGLN
ncbi:MULTISPECIES: LrgB family protein [Halomonadaceae]|jgi:predicted murein hydrolase (TIGR00659 family)|uniref:LrgB family protein n=1 Tax=Vreelandella janggokensis TaxID=370767 RepID=A0ABT4IUH5_9GAMM|nr:MULTISPECIES: LrgB family protein [Halomonas]MCW4150353.1 LrgB family protein [Halomonas sp. 18H]MCZ0927318.1 LrgB family protein [Halomonas janggokensis]MCZ0929826.1 LrgB family protein [Halomonas janggokensis]MDR5885989.1 LrgB family protein [Halomonas janggokensis]QPL45863.1 LrgB family protein [Halomonas sp. A40-4]